MPEPESTQGTPVSEFARRMALRWLVMRYSIGAVAFWAAALILGAWLRHWNLAVVGYALLAVWFYFALPALIVHCQLILDVLNYAITGETHFFPLALELVESGEIERRRSLLPPKVQAFLRVTQPAFSFAADTTPFVGIALWAVVVLIRMPDEAHSRARKFAKDDLRRAIRVAHRIEFSVVEGWADKQFRFAA